VHRRRFSDVGKTARSAGHGGELSHARVEDRERRLCSGKLLGDVAAMDGRLSGLMIAQLPWRRVDSPCHTVDSTCRRPSAVDPDHGVAAPPEMTRTSAANGGASMRAGPIGAHISIVVS
jgi:hypothetical protein